MKKLLIIALIIFGINNTLNAEPLWSFNKDVQVATFNKVAELMKIKDPGVPPMVLVAELMSDKEFADAINSTIWGKLRGNFYSVKLDVVILTYVRCPIHVLAHEFTHYFQVHHISPKWDESYEMMACEIQRHFK
jgi:hypothetical protein